MNSEIINQLFVTARDHDSHGKAKIAAAIYDRKKLVSFGFNDYLKSHSFQWRFRKDDFKCFWHAETRAIFNSLQIRNDLTGTTLYISRARKIGKKFEFGSAKPCIGCIKCIKEYGIGEVIFSLDKEGYGILNMRSSVR